MLHAQTDKEIADAEEAERYLLDQDESINVGRQ
jgi:hypothetical protein